MKNLVVIGSGMGAIKLVEQICQRSLSQWKITVIGEEKYQPYNRILLSQVLSGEQQYSAIVTHHPKWFEKYGVELLTDDKAVKIDIEKKQVTTKSHQVIDYDELVIATGAQSFVPPIPGIHDSRVISYRNLDDVFAMVQLSRAKKRAAVIGGGLLGLEAAWALKSKGLQVSVVHLMDRLMDRQIDSDASRLLEKHFAKNEIEIFLEKKTTQIFEIADCLGLSFSDGSELITDFVVLAAGIRPNIQLAQQAGIACRSGIIVDNTMKTSVDHIYAIGECVEYNGLTVGLVHPVYEMAKVLASRFLAEHDQLGLQTYQTRDIVTKLKVSGVELSSAGNFDDNAADVDILSLFDEGLGVYRKLVIHDQKLLGFVCYGDQSQVDWYASLVESEENVSAIRQSMLFGPNQSNPARSQQRIAELSDDEEICGCQGVSKGCIVSALRQQDFFNIKDLMKHTKAATGCGTCKTKVAALHQWYMETEKGLDLIEQKETICACSDYDHEELRKAVKQVQADQLPDAMKQLGWKNIDGCHKCRPALNYYLLCEFPKTYQDHSASRLVNERNHANIQRDGTYSVVPRMFGGMTSAADLRLLADVVEDFNIPCVKVTGGQRIDLLGVRKEDLASVWKRLGEGGMVSGHAYGKAVRTVKTCVGSEWCRFGTQDSTSMGIKIEQLTWGLPTPHKVKMAVSGCPRNCAESTIKDLGVVAVDSGWEIYVGGNGGTKVRVSDFLCKLSTMDEVLELVGAYLQFYRMDARYMERSSHWIERVGLERVQAAIVADPANRQALYQDFLEVQKTLQHDPWQSEVQKQAMNHQ